MKVLFLHPNGKKEYEEIQGVEPMDQLFFHKMDLVLSFKNDSMVISADIGKRHNHKPVPLEMVVRVGESPREAIKRLRQLVENQPKK